MVTILPAEVAVAPTPRGLRYGLFTAANGPADLTARQSIGGFRYQPVSCGTARVYPVECVDDPEEFNLADEADDYIDVTPFLVYATYPCTAPGSDLGDLEQRVRNRLAVGEQSAVERHLAVDLAADATALVAPDPTSLSSLVGELETWLYDTSDTGNVGVLHAPIRFMADAGRHGLLVAKGPVWQTPAGTVWSFGAYPDDGMVYITGTTALAREADVTVPDPQQLLDREHNEYRLIAQRIYTAAYECGAATALFDPDLVAS